MNKKNIVKYFKKKSSKTTMFFTTLLVSVLIILIGSFAWFTSADTKVNNFKGSHLEDILEVQINEVFSPNDKWHPGEKTTKEVKIINNGNKPAFVRVSLYEFLLSFAVDLTDQTGNANLKIVSEETENKISYSNTDTWKSGETFKNGDKIYLAEQVWVSDPKNQTGMVEYGDTSRQSAPYKYIDINYSNKISETIISSTEGYWLYEDGYFYYSKPLKPKEESQLLITGITLSDSIPNQFKGALYKLKVYSDAHDVTKPILSDWGLTDTNSKAYQLINGQLP